MSKEPTTSAFSPSYFLDCGLYTHPLSALVTIVIVCCLPLSLDTLWTLYHKCWPWGQTISFSLLYFCFFVCLLLFFVVVCWLVFLSWDWTHRDLPTCVNATMPSWFLLVLYDFSAWQCLTFNLDKWGNMCAGVRTSFDSLSSAIIYPFCLEMLRSKHALL